MVKMFISMTINSKITRTSIMKDRVENTQEILRDTTMIKKIKTITEIKFHILIHLTIKVET